MTLTAILIISPVKKFYCNILNVSLGNNFIRDNLENNPSTCP